MTMQTLQRILAEHPFFKDLEVPYLQLLAECASNVRFNAGEVIFREGEEANLFYLVRHGKVAVEMFAPGRGPVIIQTLGEGDLLGWSWLIEPYRWRFEARAVELTRAIALDGGCLRGKCEEDHTLGYELMKRVAHVIENRLQATRLQLLDVYDGVRS
jgi:CRP/FNR family cyclic AMP-dependent transcriptional regulator